MERRSGTSDERTEHLSRALVGRLEKVRIHVVSRRWIRMAETSRHCSHRNAGGQRLRRREVAKVVQAAGHGCCVGCSSVARQGLIL
jgi:hypothetical protein